MTTQPQNNDLRRKADEKIAQKESKLFKDYVDKDFGFGNYIFISLDDAIDAMLEFLQEQGQQEALEYKKEMSILERCRLTLEKFKAVVYLLKEEEDFDKISALDKVSETIQTVLEGINLHSESLNSLKENK